MSLLLQYYYVLHRFLTVITVQKCFLFLKQWNHAFGFFILLTLLRQKICVMSNELLVNVLSLTVES